MDHSQEKGIFVCRFFSTEGPFGFLLRASMYTGITIKVLLSFVVVVHTVGRYFFKKPITGMVELSCLALVVSVFLSFAYTQSVNGHITLDILTGKYSVKAKMVTDIIINVLLLIMSVLVAWRTFIVAHHIMEKGVITATLRIPEYPFIYLTAIGWLLFGIVILIQLVNSVYTAVASFPKNR